MIKTWLALLFPLLFFSQANAATLTFALRGNSTTAYYAGGYATPVQIGTITVDAGGIDSILNLDQGSLGQRGLYYAGRGNLGTSNKMTIVWSGAFGATAQNMTMISVTGPGLLGRVIMRYTSANAISITVGKDTTGATINFGSLSWTNTPGTYYDYCLQLDSSTTASGLSIMLYRDGSSVLAPNNASDTWANPTTVNHKQIIVGSDDATTLLNTQTKVREVLIFDGLQDCSSFTGAGRSSYYSASNVNGNHVNAYSRGRAVNK